MIMWLITVMMMMQNDNYSHTDEDAVILMTVLAAVKIMCQI